MLQVDCLRPHDRMDFLGLASAMKSTEGMIEGLIIPPTETHRGGA